MKPEYREVPEVKENFEQGMKSLFQAPKVSSKKRKQAKPSTLRKSKRSDKDFRFPRPCRFLAPRVLFARQFPIGQTGTVSAAAIQVGFHCETGLVTALDYLVKGEPPSIHCSVIGTVLVVQPKRRYPCDNSPSPEEESGTMSRNVASPADRLVKNERRDPLPTCLLYLATTKYSGSFGRGQMTHSEIC
jgi:hypothetical protein